LGSAFPDIHYTIDDVLAEDDRVAIRWHWSGTHRGSYRGVEPTERSLTNAGAAIFRLRSGKIVTAALETDRLGFLQSIGVVPPNEILFKPRVPAEKPKAAAP
jgi:predicted ester cyclase